MTSSLLWIITFTIFLIIGVPVSIAIGLGAAVAILINGLAPIQYVANGIFDMYNSFVLIAIPLFILAGVIMSTGDMAKRIWNFADSLVGSFSGGLGAVTVIANMIFGALSGSSTAAAGGLVPMAVGGMTEHGYPKKYSAALGASASVLAQNIPPSIVAVVFGYVAGTSIVGQLMAGFLPGVLIGIGLIIANYFMYNHFVRKGIIRPAADKRFSINELLKSIKESFWALLTPVILLGGMISGLFTPTEASAVACVYALVVSLFVYRSLKFSDLPEIFITTAKITGASMLVIGAAALATYIFNVDHFNEYIGSVILNLSGNNPYIIETLIVIVLFITGMFLDALPAQLMFVPIFLPIANAVGINPTHLGVIMISTLSIGLVTPPVGICLFVTCAITKITIGDLGREMIPFILVATFVLLLIAIFPSISLFLPKILNLI